MFTTVLLAAALTTQLPDPPTPEATPEVQVLLQANATDIIIPAVIPVSRQVQCVIEGISLDDVTKGKVYVRTFPRGKVVVTDGISFITRKPFLNVVCDTPGKYTLLFILHRGEKLVIVERDFEVVK